MFSTQYLARLLLGTSVVLALASCSLFSSPSSTSLHLHEIDGAGWKEVQSSPYVYEIANGDSGSTFMTAIKDCDQKKSLTPAVASRQLLVGLKDIRIEIQEQTTVADIPAVRTQVRARLEDQSLDLLTYTVPHDTCVYDFVLWRAPGTDDSSTAALLEDDSRFSKILSQHFESFLK